MSLTSDEELLIALESDEWGRPQALGAVIVGQYTRAFCFFHRFGNDTACLKFNVQTGRSSFAAVVNIRARVPTFAYRYLRSFLAPTAMGSPFLGISAIGSAWYSFNTRQVQTWAVCHSIECGGIMKPLRVQYVEGLRLG